MLLSDEPGQRRQKMRGIDFVLYLALYLRLCQGVKI